MSNKISDMKQIQLEDMNKDQLIEFIDAFEIEGFDKRSSEASMIEAIIASGKYTGGLKESNGSVITKDGVRVHKKLGKYIKCKVHTLDGVNDIHVGLNDYTADFYAGTVVHLPEKVIAFLKTTGFSKHTFDPKAVSENGTLGVHKHEITSNYIIEIME